MITIFYSCHQCGVKDAEVMVENGVQWPRLACVIAIDVDHRERSPSCRATKMSEMKLSPSTPVVVATKH